MRRVLTAYPAWALIGAVIGAVAIGFAAVSYRDGSFGIWYPLALLAGGLFVGGSSIVFIYVLYRIRHVTE